MSEIFNLIDNANTIAILPHTSPDADSLGSCFAFKLVLEGMGKSATVITEDGIPKYLAFLGVKCETFTDDFEAYDLCICFDCADLGRLGNRKAVYNAAKTTINIDHHKTNDNFAQYNLIDPAASSVGEMCYMLFCDNSIGIKTDIAVPLYAAISSDTGGFRYSNTTPQTMRVAADLLAFGVDCAKINRLLFDTENIGALKLKGLVSQSLRLYAGGLIAVGSATKGMMEQCGIDSGEVENIVDIVRCVEGIEVAVSFKESGKGIRVSMRSNEWLDVSEVAVLFGGGGHARAAGYTSDMGMDDSEKAIVEVLTAILKDR